MRTTSSPERTPPSASTVRPSPTVSRTRGSARRVDGAPSSWRPP